MSVAERNKQVALAYLEALGRGNGAAAAACLRPDAQIVGKGFGKFAGPCGFDEFLGRIEALNRLVPEGLRFFIHSVIGEDDRVVIECEGSATLCNGEPYCNQYAMVFTFREGRILNVNEYLCTKLADEALYPLVASLQGS